MERVSFEIERQDVADTLRSEAEAHGRTVEAELAALVERTYVPSLSNRDAPRYPAGMEPLPDERMGSWLYRISRPGFDFEIERDRTPHLGFDG